MDEKYYWFSYYKITKFGCVFEEDVTDEHPFKTMKNIRESSDGCDYTLINFKEINKGEYDYFSGECADIL